MEAVKIVSSQFGLSPEEAAHNKVAHGHTVKRSITTVLRRMSGDVGERITSHHDLHLASEVAVAAHMKATAFGVSSCEHDDLIDVGVPPTLPQAVAELTGEAVVVEAALPSCNNAGGGEDSGNTFAI